MIKKVSINNNYPKVPKLDKRDTKTVVGMALCGTASSVIGLKILKMPLKNIVQECGGIVNFLKSTTILRNTAIGAFIGAGTVALSKIIADKNKNK